MVSLFEFVVSPFLSSACWEAGEIIMYMLFILHDTRATVISPVQVTSGQSGLLLLQVLFPPFDPAVLEPNFDLCLRQVQ